MCIINSIVFLLCYFPDPDVVGYNIFDDLPEDTEFIQKSNKNCQEIASSSTTTPEKCVKTPPKRKSPLRRKSKQKDAVDAVTTTMTTTTTVSEAQSSGGTNTGGDSDAELFEIEESDTPLIPLYHLRDEGTAQKWVLLSDLCYLLKVKSKDTLLKLVSVINVLYSFFLFFFYLKILKIVQSFFFLHSAISRFEPNDKYQSEGSFA